MNRSVLRSGALALLLSSLPAVAIATSLGVAVVGCGGGGAGARAPVNTPAAPNPGGVVGAIAAATTAVNAQLDLGAFAAFREQASLSDLVIPDVPGLRDRAFAVEDDGVVRILSLAGATPALDRALQLDAAVFVPGAAAGALSIQDAHTALVTSSGTNNENVYVFDPSTAQTTAQVGKVALSALTVTWPAGTRNSKGVDVGGAPLALTYTAGAALAGGRLFFASSNLDASYDYNPGTVVAYAWNPSTRTISGQAAVFKTTDFNPTAVTRVVTQAGELLLVTNGGAFGAPSSSVDVLHAATLRHVATIPLGARSASGPIVVSPDGRRGYLGSSSAAEVYVLDLEGLAGEAQNQTPLSRPARYLGGWTLPAAGAFAWISGLALSHTGDFLYATNYNTSELFVLDLEQPGLARQLAGFARTGDTSNFQGLASKVAVRPGVPGVDYQGPSIFVATINLAAADRTLTDVEVVLDAVTVDLH